MSSPTWLPTTAEQVEEHFRAWVPRLRQGWPRATWFRRAWPNAAGHLVGLAAPATERPQTALVWTAGLHGIEGRVGSVVLDWFLHDFAARLDPSTTSLYVLPVLNPWGLTQARRVNQANVDLNRNFQEPTAQGAFPSVKNPGYEALATFLNPRGPVSLQARWRFWLRALRALRRAGGVAAVRRASLQGQSSYPTGIFFSGQTWQPEVQAIRGWFADILPQHERLLHVDIHTGFGPRRVLSLIFPTAEPRGVAEWRRLLGYEPITRVAAAEFYPVQGDLGSYVLRQAQRVGVTATSLAFEFGTLGASSLAQMRSLRALIVENQYVHFGATSAAAAAWVADEFQALFAPREAAWWRAAEAQARRAFQGLVTWLQGQAA